jgi:hypothetical protein
MGLRNVEDLGGELRLGAGRQPGRLVPAARPVRQEDLKDAEPDTLRYRLLSLPARLVRHAHARVLKISLTWPWRGAFLACWQRLCALPAPA